MIFKNSNYSQQTIPALLGLGIGQIMLLMLVISGGGLVGCQSPQPSEPTTSEDRPPSEEFENTLTLEDVVLEQVDEEGQLLWQVEAKQASYSQDQKIATVTEPVGELFVKGELRYKIEAKQGELHQDGQRLFLRDDIVAVDLENGIVLRGQELEWIVNEQIMIVRDNVTGEHEKMQAIATEVQLFNDDKRVEFWNQVVINFKEVGVQLRTDHVIWRWEEERFISERRVEIDRLENMVVTDRAVAKSAELDLTTAIATFKDNVQIALSNPPLQLSSAQLQWNYQEQTLNSPGQITIIDRQEQLTFSGDQGWGDLDSQIFNLIGNVLGVAENRQAQINADLLTWYVPQQAFKAEGDVIYRQVDPQMTLRGEVATGQFSTQTVVVTGGNQGDRVVTEIFP
ncbi:MAG: LPS export ABC transporter periplasmic protein LptC [Arthrospira sp. SH-MAG29]|nr:LPS export ABC transporter periplasmic protein LptC [Arthrospira sp. SH-MAG29]